jgi:hypothetical protein
MNDFNGSNNKDDNDDWLTQGLAEDDLPDDNFSAPVMKRMTISNRIQSLLVVFVPALAVGLLLLLVPRKWLSEWTANAAAFLQGLSTNSHLMYSLKITGQSFGPSEAIGIILVLIFFGVVGLVESKR